MYKLTRLLLLLILAYGLPRTLPVRAQLQSAQADVTVLQSYFQFILYIHILCFPIQDLNVLNPTL